MPAQLRKLGYTFRDCADSMASSDDKHAAIPCCTASCGSPRQTSARLLEINARITKTGPRTIQTCLCITRTALGITPSSRRITQTVLRITRSCLRITQRVFRITKTRVDAATTGDFVMRINHFHPAAIKCQRDRDDVLDAWPCSIHRQCPIPNGNAASASVIPVIMAGCTAAVARW